MNLDQSSHGLVKCLVAGTPLAYSIEHMSPRARRYPTVASKDIKALLRKADRLFAEGERAQKRARESLAEHFKQEAANRPTAEDRARRARMARKPK